MFHRASARLLGSHSTNSKSKRSRKLKYLPSERRLEMGLQMPSFESCVSNGTTTMRLSLPTKVAEIYPHSARFSASRTTLRATL